MLEVGGVYSSTVLVVARWVLDAGVHQGDLLNKKTRITSECTLQEQ
jgi:hypothetical protein